MFFNAKIFGHLVKSPYLCTRKTSRDGAVVARWAHNPKVGGSSPPPATNEDESEIPVRFFSYKKRDCQNKN